MICNLFSEIEAGVLDLKAERVHLRVRDFAGWHCGVADTHIEGVWHLEA